MAQYYMQSIIMYCENGKVILGGNLGNELGEKNQDQYQSTFADNCDAIKRRVWYAILLFSALEAVCYSQH